MRQPSPALSELARQLLRHEAGGSDEPQAAAAALERACEKLSGELENLVGPGGAAALVRRARTLAKRELPDGGGGGTAPGPEPAGSAAVLAHLVGLLVGLLGEELGLRPVRKIWPDVASGGGAPSSTETEG